jgi:hypothetical protein
MVFGALLLTHGAAPPMRHPHARAWCPKREKSCQRADDRPNVHPNILDNMHQHREGRGGSQQAAAASGNSAAQLQWAHMVARPKRSNPPRTGCKSHELLLHPALETLNETAAGLPCLFAPTVGQQQQ